MNTQTLHLQNTMRVVVPLPKEVHISERDMATYRLVQLKLDYQRGQVQKCVDGINSTHARRWDRMHKVVYSVAGGMMVLAVVGEIVRRVLH